MKMKTVKKFLTCTKLEVMILFMKSVRKAMSFSFPPTAASKVGELNVSHTYSNAAKMKYRDEQSIKPLCYINHVAGVFRWY